MRVEIKNSLFDLMDEIGIDDRDQPSFNKFDHAARSAANQPAHMQFWRNLNPSSEFLAAIRARLNNQWAESHRPIIRSRNQKSKSR